MVRRGTPRHRNRGGSTEKMRRGSLLLPKPPTAEEERGRKEGGRRKGLQRGFENGRKGKARTYKKFRMRERRRRGKTKKISCIDIRIGLLKIRS